MLSFIIEKQRGTSWEIFDFINIESGSERDAIEDYRERVYMLKTKTRLVEYRRGAVIDTKEAHRE